MAKNKNKDEKKREQEAKEQNGQQKNTAASSKEKEKGEKEGQASQETVSKEEYDQLNDKYLRLFAEFENYKKRTVRERLDLLQTASKETIADLLPILDDFDRAKRTAESEENDEQFSEGVELVYNKLYRTLEQKGLKPMESTGEPFDADLHEAVTEIPAPSEEMKGKVIDTVEKGYFLKEKIIRHAKVVVGK